MASIQVMLCFFVLSILVTRSYPFNPIANLSPKSDIELLEFSLNLEYLEAEFFLHGATGRGIDDVDPELAQGGPLPIGGNKAVLDAFTRDIILQFGYQEVGHLRAIKRTIEGFPRPLLNISKEVFAEIVDSAFGKSLQPPFDPYANVINFLLASYVIPYVGLTGYVGANPKLQNATFKKLVGGLLGVESGQDAVIRAMLYDSGHLQVHPYEVTVATFTDRISSLRNKLGNEGLRDDGLGVPRLGGTVGRTFGNVLAGDRDSLAYGRTPQEILRIVYGGGDEHVPGGFFPWGAHGRIAKSYLKSSM
ncbi:hypothetical protein PIB30_074389 [Stylosanthes scabra]|uniref:Desiccation-related protein PCC13-62 n=1 Tax=Stylosanthes scabra TaxID=79078 RepID=A0ABU6YP26_9FABA|nr:hypothetical protein [Stylosanthes scabra]